MNIPETTPDWVEKLRTAPRPRERPWVLIPLALGMLAGATVVRPCVAEADDRATAEERAVAFDLARYTANEANLDGWADAVLLWQSAETHGDTLETRLAWLYRHSQCVLARVPAQHCDPAAAWTRDLNRRGHQPQGWPAEASWPRARPMWFGLLAWCLRVVTGEITWRPCPSAPDTWDGRRWLLSAIRRGHTPLDCRDPATGQHLRNEGYRWPRPSS